MNKEQQYRDVLKKIAGHDSYDGKTCEYCRDLARKVLDEQEEQPEEWQGVVCYNEVCGKHQLMNCPMCSHKPGSCDGCKKVEVGEQPEECKKCGQGLEHIHDKPLIGDCPVCDGKCKGHSYTVEQSECEGKYCIFVCKECGSDKQCEHTKKPTIKHNPKNGGCDGCIAEMLKSPMTVQYAKQPTLLEEFDQKFPTELENPDEVLEWVKTKLINFISKL